MHLSDYKRREYIRCGLLIFFFLAVPIIIGFSVVASNARKRNRESDAFTVSTLSPSHLRTSVPSAFAITSAPSTRPPVSTDAPTIAPATATPTTSQRQDLLDIIIPLILDNGTMVETPGSPQYQALSWLVSDGASADSAAVVAQRFALATLYYSTNSFTSGSRSWLNASGWLSSDDECSWFGASCDGSSSLTGLNLTDNQLIGLIPDEISMLTKLQMLSLNANMLQSTIPTAIGLLTALKILDLSNNSLSGTLVSEIGSLTSLTRLSLQANNLKGSIPDQLGALLGLDQVRLDSNNLTGEVPDTVCYAFSASQPRFYSDCAGSSPEIICPAYPCCTYCCEGGTCECMYAGTGFDFLC